jgi:hypothetical protein
VDNSAVRRFEGLDCNCVTWVNSVIRDMAWILNKQSIWPLTFFIFGFIVVKARAVISVMGVKSQRISR